MFPFKPTPTKVLFPKVTPLILFAVELSVVALSQDAPLFVDLTIFPEEATDTNIPEPEEDEELSEEDEELSEVLVELSEESSEESSEEVVVLSLVVDAPSSLLLLQE